MHLSVKMTNVRMRTGEFAVHLVHQNKCIKRFIDSCVTCRKDKGAHYNVRICESWPLRHSEMSFGLFDIVQVDIIGPYRYKSGPLTRCPIHTVDGNLQHHQLCTCIRKPHVGDQTSSDNNRRSRISSKSWSKCCDSCTRGTSS